MVVLDRHVDHRHGDERSHYRAYTLEYPDDYGRILERGEKDGDKEDGHEGRKRRAQRSGDAALYAPELVAGKDGHVHGEHARSALRQCDDVRKLVFPYPSARIHLALDDGNHGIPSTYGEGPDLGENAENFH